MLKNAPVYKNARAHHLSLYTVHVVCIIYIPFMLPCMYTVHVYCTRTGIMDSQDCIVAVQDNHYCTHECAGV